MLTLITLLVMTALNLASSNFRAVSNTQFRDEAVAAANVAIQQVIGSNFIELEEARISRSTWTTTIRRGRITW